jgi:hypothetical protein
VTLTGCAPPCALPTCIQNWLFGPAWSVFYTSMGVASWFVGRSDKKGKAAALALYGAQLAVNLAWTPLFFKAHALDVALVDITSGWRGPGGGGGKGRGGVGGGAGWGGWLGMLACSSRRCSTCSRSSKSMMVCWNGTHPCSSMCTAHSGG